MAGWNTFRRAVARQQYLQDRLDGKPDPHKPVPNKKPAKKPTRKKAQA